MSLLDEKTIVLDIVFRRPGINRRGSLDEVETDADRAMLRLGKSIVDSQEYRNVAHVAQNFRGWVRTRCVPTKALKEGAYRIPTGLLEEVYDELGKAKTDYTERAEAFVAAFPALKEEARVRLQSQFREEDYQPDMAKLLSAFRVDHRLIDYGLPNADKLGATIHNAELAAAQKEMAVVAEECKQALRASLLALLQQLSHSLGFRPDGKKCALHDTTYDKVLDFLELFSKRDVLGDPECKAIVEQAKTVLAGGGGYVDAKELRSNEGFRAQVCAATDGIIQTLGAMVETTTARAITLEDDE